MSEDRNRAAEFVELYKGMDHAGKMWTGLIIRALACGDKAEAETAYRMAFAEKGVPVDEEGVRLLRGESA